MLTVFFVCLVLVYSLLASFPSVKHCLQLQLCAVESKNFTIQNGCAWKRCIYWAIDILWFLISDIICRSWIVLFGLQQAHSLTTTVTVTVTATETAKVTATKAATTHKNANTQYLIRVQLINEAFNRLILWL